MSNLSYIRWIGPLFLTILSTVPGNCLAQSHGSALSVNVDVSGKRFAGLHVHDDISGRTLDIGEAFVLALKDKTLLRSTDMQISPLDKQTLLAP